MRPRLRAAAVCVVVARAASAQIGGGPIGAPQSAGATPWMLLSGDVNAYGEAYGASGIDLRRPSETGRLSFRPTLSFFDNTLSIAVDAYLSTEGNAARPNVNAVGISPEWSWGRAHAGDFLGYTSDLTMSGVTLRGAGVELFPRGFRLRQFVGWMQVQTDSAAFRYVRFVSATKLGIGGEHGSLLAVNLVRFHDLGDSSVFVERQTIVPRLGLNGLPMVDSVTGLPINDTTTSAIRPQESLVASLEGAIGILDGALALRGELAAAAFTRDVGSDVAQSSSIPSFVSRDVFTVRTSTNADLAYDLQAVWTAPGLTVNAGMTRVGAGYTAPMVASLVPDRAAWNAGFSLQSFGGRLATRASFRGESDNTLGQRAFTTRRDRLLVMFTGRPVGSWIAGLSASLYAMGNDAGGIDAFTSLSQSYSATASGMVTPFARPASLACSFTVALTNSGSGAGVRQNVASLGATASFSQPLSPTLTGTFGLMAQSTRTTATTRSIDSSGAAAAATTQFTQGGPNVGCSILALDGSWRTTAGVGFIFSTTARSASQSVTSSYQITPGDVLNLSLVSTFVTGLSAPSFREIRLGLEYAHRF